MAEGKVTRIHHIGVTVNDAAATLQAWEQLLDCKGKVVDIPENKMKIGVLHVAGVTFFFNEYTDPSKKAKTVDGLELPVEFSGHRIVNRNGEGISHIAFETSNLDYHIGKARDGGMGIKLDHHRDALEGICNFINPEDVALPLEFMMPVEGRKNPLE
jgi:catechol 2,3-dioxygenase-like lactoylglutathione lyase family enzyme